VFEVVSNDIGWFREVEENDVRLPRQTALPLANS